MSRRTPRYGPAHAVAGELNIEGILETLVKHEVDFILIGGVAVGHHGFVRATKDVDIVPDPDRAQLRKLWNALVDLAAQPLSLGDFRPEEMPAPFTLEGLLQLGNWDLGTRYGRLDILEHIDGVLESGADYARLRERAVAHDYAFGRVWVVGYEDLLDLKNVAGRDQDLIDIRALKEARGETDVGQ